VSLPIKEFRSKEAYDKEIEALCNQLKVLGLDDRTLTLMVENPGATQPSTASLDSAQYDLLARLNALAGERLERDCALSESQGSKRQEIGLHLLSIDANLAVLLFPGELSSRIGLAIRQRSSLSNLIIVTYANDYAGYIVPAEEYPMGGYEVGVSHFKAEAETILTQAILDLIAEATSEETR
jgi:hypothetical protein